MKTKMKSSPQPPRVHVPGAFRSGANVPFSGIYSLSHSHPLIHSTRLLQGHIFPSCPKCHDVITFTLMNQVIVESASSRFRLLMAR